MRYISHSTITMLISDEYMMNGEHVRPYTTRLNFCCLFVSASTKAEILSAINMAMRCQSPPFSTH